MNIKYIQKINIIFVFVRNKYINNTQNRFLSSKYFPMKKIHLTFLLLIIVLIQACGLRRNGFVCGMMSNIVLEPELNIYHFQGYITNDSASALTAITESNNKIYSPDYNFYLEYKSIKKNVYENVILYDSNKRVIANINQFTLGDKLIWLEKCVIIDKGVSKTNEKSVIEFATGKIENYQSEDWFMFVGQTNNQAFFVSETDEAKISSLTVKHSHSIISINEKGIHLALDNPSFGESYPDSTYYYHYFTPTFAIRSLQLSNSSYDEKSLKIEFLLNDHLVYSPDSISSFFSLEDIYHSQGTSYLKINSNEVYRITPTSFEKIVDFRECNITGWVRDFKIEGDYLIFLTQKNGTEDTTSGTQNFIYKTKNGLLTNATVYGYNEIGILNIKTKECIYPRIN